MLNIVDFHEQIVKTRCNGGPTVCIGVLQETKYLALELKFFNCSMRQKMKFLHETQQHVMSWLSFDSEPSTGQQKQASRL